MQHHLKHAIEDPRNAVLIVSWQAPHTLGRRIVERQSKVRIFGREHRLRARVEAVIGYSAHADRNGLLEWVRPIARDLKQAFVVHGDPEPAAALADGFPPFGRPLQTIADLCPAELAADPAHPHVIAGERRAVLGHQIEVFRYGHRALDRCLVASRVASCDGQGVLAAA